MEDDHVDSAVVDVHPAGIDVSFPNSGDGPLPPISIHCEPRPIPSVLDRVILCLKGQLLVLRAFVPKEYVQTIRAPMLKGCPVRSVCKKDIGVTENC